jgi:superfamily II DNA or RNA helicase
MAAFTELLASFDVDAGKRGKQFEHFVKWFLQNDPEWSTQVDQVWLWEEYPDRWGIDCGIDLVFRHKNGESWAVQAKCYSQQHDITKHDVDKFLSESNRKGIDKRLLIATTDRIGANAKQVCEAQEKSVFRYLLSNFESANIEYPATLADLHSVKRKPKPTPREHQLEAIDGVVTGFNATDRGQLIMACGTGKTFTTLWIKEKLDATSTLILLPSLGLLSQTLHEWTLAANQPFEVLCVCSDETVGKKSSDEAIHSVADVAFPVTSNVEEIRKFLYRDGAKIVLSTYQSSPLIAEAQIVSTVPAFDLAIADEAHRCAGKVGNDFTTVLDRQLIRSNKRLFATATPRTYSTNVKKTAGERGIDVVGMDDEAVFGKVLYSLPFGEAIKRGLLTDYQVVIIGVDNPTIAAWIENREFVKTESGIENDAESLAAQIGLLKAYKDYDLRRVISFHSRVKRAEQFSKDLINVIGWVGDEHKPSGTMRADFVSGEMATDKRRIKLAQLKSLSLLERGLLTNARCLSEGVDVPSLDGVAFIDPRSSQIDIIQAVGRAIRLSANKATGTIILPVFIEAGLHAISSIEESNFKPIWDVLNALKAHDDVLSAEMDHIRTEMGRRLGGSFRPVLPVKIHFDLPASIGEEFSDALRTHLVERTTSDWVFGFGVLEKYVEVLGDSLVPATYKTTDGFGLGTWVKTQRRFQNSLSEVRRGLLEKLPRWSWNTHEDAWETGFNKLADYVTRTGSCEMPTDLILDDGYRLAQWVGVQRVRRDFLLADATSRLENLAGWSWNLRDKAWEKGFKYFQEYVIKTGDANILQTVRHESGFSIGAWVSSQRARRDKLHPDQIVRLENLPGWVWSTLDQAWITGLKYLDEYVKENGTSSVPKTYKAPDGYSLGAWVSRKRARSEGLSSERIATLERMVGWTWNKFADSWESNFALLVEYAQTNNNCLVPDSFTTPSGSQLGAWVGKQRATRHKLSADRLSRIEALPGWSWSPREDAWDIGFKHLDEYVNEFGSFPLKSYVSADGYQLGTWVGTQRSRSKRLTESQKRKLELLSGWVWNSLDAKWETGYSHLAEYVKNHGTANVPQRYKLADGYSLGSWVTSQRGSKDSLPEERRNRLEVLNGWVWNGVEILWVNAFVSLCEYVKEHGTALVPRGYTTASGLKLGRWVSNQRFKKGSLPLEFRQKLEGVSGWSWDPHDDAWEHGFSMLKAYVLRVGNSDVPQKFKTEDEYSLGAWVSKQRAKVKELSMPSERLEKIKQLTGW